MTNVAEYVIGPGRELGSGVINSVDSLTLSKLINDTG